MSNIIRVEKNANYVVMNRTALQDKKLSWKAKGIMAYLLSMPDDWIFHMKELIKHSTDGKDSFNAGFGELKKHGYVKRIRKSDAEGKFIWETIVYEVPHTDFPSMDNPVLEKPSMEKPVLENPHLLSTEELSTDLLSIEELSTEGIKDIVDPVQDLFNHYLSKNIIRHSKITGAMKTAAKARLKDYSFEQLIQAIDNYAIVFHGDYWFKTKYGFADLMRDKDIRKFIDDAEPLNNFANRGAGYGVDRTSPPRNDAKQARIDEANERRKRIAGIKPNRDTDVTF